MKASESEVAPISIDGHIRIAYQWPAGQIGGEFLSRLRDEGRLYGLACAACKRVAVPPRSRCLSCRTISDSWVPVGPTGEILSWTSTGAATFVLVKLAGADTALLHLLLDEKPIGLAIGAVVHAVFAERRRGAITDLQGFRLGER